MAGKGIMGAGGHRQSRRVGKRGRAAELQRARPLASADVRERQILDAMLTRARSPIAFLDTEFRYVRVNPAFAAGVGRSAAELNGHRHFDLYPNPEAYAAFERVLRTGEPVEEREVPYRFPDQPGRGVTYWDWSLAPVLDRNGVMQGLVLTVEEVTDRARDRRLAEEQTRELAEREERYRRVLAHLGSGFVLCQAIYRDEHPVDFRCVEVNSAVQRETGLGPEEVVGQLAKEFLPRIKEDVVEWMEVFTSVVQTGRPVEKDRFSPALQRWFAISVYRPMKDHVAVVFRDVSERKRLEESLQTAAERLSLAQRASRSAVWDVDLRTMQQHWSPEYYELYGLDPAVWTPSWESWLASIDPADRERVEQEARLAAQRVGEAYLEYRCQHPRLGLRWFAGVGVTIAGPDGRPARMVGLTMDVTARKQLEEERERHMAEVLQANEDKERFFNILSHELRTPLATILSSVQILSSPRADARQRRRALQLLERNVNHQTRLIDDLVDLSRLRRGTVILQQELVDLREVLSVQCDAVRPDALRAGLSMSLSSPDDPVLVFADPDRLGQIIANLLTNAIKFNSPGGSVSLALALEERQAIIRVRDTGAGISAELLPHLFEPFRRAEPDSSRVRGGLGIGLAIARSLSELHRGRLDAFSAGPGRGSEFVLRLPLAAVA